MALMKEQCRAAAAGPLDGVEVTRCETTLNGVCRQLDDMNLDTYSRNNLHN